MYPIPPTETLIETKTCLFCGAAFHITDRDVKILGKLTPNIAGKHFPLPVPTACPECRKIRLLAWRNETKLYKRKCDATGKSIISHFPPNTPFKVYEEAFWNSDKWDPKEYWQEFDFSRPFFEQFGELLKNIPRPWTAKAPPMENSDYCNNCGYLKNSYLCFNAQNLEDCLYCIDTWYSDHCIDCYAVYRSHFCYECILAYDSYDVQHAYDIKNCRNSRFVLSCEGCQNCYGCFGLVNQQYRIYNIQYTRKEYETRLQDILALPLSEQKLRFSAFHKRKYEKKSLPNTGSENVYASENTVRSKNVVGGKNLQDVEDVRYASILHETKLSMDFYIWWHHAERIYSCQQVGNHAYSVYFSPSCWGDIHDLYYSHLCLFNTHDCFGCVGLKNGESYCILNKQYTREEYQALVPRIIEHMQKTGEWGEFFPPHLSPHGYNESVSSILYPLDREHALSLGFNWSDYEAPFPKVEKIIPAERLPEDIAKIPDDILNWAIECETTKRPYRIVKQELEFYRQHNLPIPRQHPDERQSERLKWHINH